MIGPQGGFVVSGDLKGLGVQSWGLSQGSLVMGWVVGVEPRTLKNTERPPLIRPHQTPKRNTPFPQAKTHLKAPRLEAQRARVGAVRVGVRREAGPRVVAGPEVEGGAGAGRELGGLYRPAHTAVGDIPSKWGEGL